MIFAEPVVKTEAGDPAGISAGDISFSGHCLYKDIHGKYDKYKKIAVLDDGFSALNIKRHLNIVLIDRTINIFSQNVIPAGVLREPLSVLKYADAIVITKNAKQASDSLKTADKSIEKDIKRFNESAPIFYSCYNPTRLLGGGDGLISLDFERLRDIKTDIITICGIGNPEYFYDNLISCGIKIDRKFEFEDHHDYSEEDIIGLSNGLNSDNPYIIITTLKDYVKLKRFAKQGKFKALVKDIYYVDFELVIDKSFFEFIYNNYRKYVENINPDLLSYVFKDIHAI